VSGNIINNKVAEQVAELALDASHLSQYFPEDSNETVLFTAGGVVNTFGAWVEIVDNNAVTFTSKLVACKGHISHIAVEDASVKDKVYILEIAYGATKIVVVRDRLVSATVQLSTLQQGRRRSLHIPAGVIVYYRMKCETALATARLAIRYHCHS